MLLQRNVLLIVARYKNVTEISSQRLDHLWKVKRAKVFVQWTRLFVSVFTVPSILWRFRQLLSTAST